MIVPIRQDDRHWVLRLFKASRRVWPHGGDLAWYRYWQKKDDDGRERWDKFVDDAGEAHGFIHWRMRIDGWKSVLEVIVDEPYRGRGSGRAMVNFVGKPVRLKALVGGGAESFYGALGFSAVGEARDKGGRRYIVYELGRELGGLL